MIDSIENALDVKECCCHCTHCHETKELVNKE